MPFLSVFRKKSPVFFPVGPFFRVLQIKCFMRVAKGTEGRSLPLPFFENWKVPLFEEKIP